MGDAEGRGMEGWGMGVVSMGESGLRGRRFSIVFSKLSSFWSTVVKSSKESSFSFRESRSSFVFRLSFLMFSMLQLTIKKF